MKTWHMTHRVWLRVALIGLSFGGSMLAGVNFAQADGSRGGATVLVAQATSQVQRELLKAALAMGLGGYNMTHNPFVGDLGRGGQNDITLTLRRDVDYAIIGVCDNDCRDIDLVLYDDNGNLIASDVQQDDTPMVKVSPRWNAQFTIRVKMASCSNAPCRYGIGAFGR
jgi:hypothetical protein